MSTSERDLLVALRVPLGRLEIAELELWELGATGIEQRDRTTLVKEPAEGEVVLVAAFDSEAAAKHAWRALSGEYETDLLELPRRNWATEWRRGFGPQRIGGHLVLCPSWESVRREPGDVVLTIDPENAFGSGDHETTRLVLRLLVELIRGGERVLDVGCGSGILSIAATRLGAASSVAIDIDDDAVAVARRNAMLNGVASRCEVSTRRIERVEGVYDVVLANIETEVLVHMPDPLQARMGPGGVLVLSGILRCERDALLAAYGSMEIEREIHEGQWCALLLRRAQR